MKIAIAVEEQSMESIICPSFGRAPYFLIYDTKTHMKTYLDNDVKESQCGKGIKAAQMIVDENADVVIAINSTDRLFREPESFPQNLAMFRKITAGLA